MAIATTDSAGIILSRAAQAHADRAQAAGLNLNLLALAHDARAASDITHETWAAAHWVLADPILIAPYLARCRQLRWLQSTWAGIESLLVPGLRRDYCLTNVREAFGPLMLEYVLTYLLQHERQVKLHQQAQQARHWVTQSTGSIRGKTALILGVGSIGLALAQGLRQLGVRVLGVGLSARPQCPRELDDYLPFHQCDHFLAQADYLISVLPATAQTDNLIDQRLLAQLPAHAVLINVGRGNALVEADLIASLRAGRLAHAVLDVFRSEPLPADHPFWETPNITLTSHTAAPSFADDIAAVFIANYQRFMRHEPLAFTVDFARGY